MEMVGDFNEGARHELLRSTDIPIAEDWMWNVTINGMSCARNTN
jgi:hypothetical protein